MRLLSEQSAIHEFDQGVDDMVVLLMNKGGMDFEIIVQGLPSVYPAEVVKALRRLENSGRVDAGFVRTILKEVSVPNGRVASPRVPVPHPADFDWPFSVQAETVLVEVVKAFAPKDSLVALLGAPRLASCLSSTRNYELLVVDSNRSALDLVREARTTRIQLDITKDEPLDVQARLVVLDPPWYEDYFQAFLWFASRICGSNAHVIMTLPPAGTRPGIKSERQRILSWARRAGFKRIHHKRGALAYETPQFEINALAAEGIHRVPLLWRRGDLVVFEARGERGNPNLRRPSPPLDKISWIEIEIEGIRVKLRSQDSKWIADPRLKPLIPGDVLASVSRRDPRRKEIDVWTSGNRVFGCRNTALLGSVIAPLAGNGADFRRTHSVLPGQLERAVISETVAQISALIQAEQQHSHMISPSEAPKQG